MNERLFFGLFLAAAVSGGHAAAGEGVFPYRVGRFEVFLLVEAERPGNTAILADADAAVLQSLIPEGGFTGSTNAILVRMPGRNILIDAGTGQQGALIERMASIGVRPEQIDDVLITHLHGDHFGGLLQNGAPAFPRARVHLSAPEHAFFTEERPNEAAVAALAAYADRISTFEPRELGTRLRMLLPGITPIAAYGHTPGHTPGHTLFLIESRGERLLVIGDLLHVAPVQFAMPEISAVFDIDPVAAAATRRRVLSFAAENRIPVAGMHIAYPGIGMVGFDGDGFSFTPEE